MHSARGESNAAPEGLGLDVVFFAVEPLHLAVVVFDVDLPPRGPGRNTCEMPPGRQEERGGEGSLLLPVGGKDGALGGKGRGSSDKGVRDISNHRNMRHPQACPNPSSAEVAAVLPLPVRGGKNGSMATSGWRWRRGVAGSGPA